MSPNQLFCNYCLQRDPFSFLVRYCLTLGGPADAWSTHQPQTSIPSAASGTVSRRGRGSDSGSGGQVRFPDQRLEAEGRHAPWQHGLLTGAAAPQTPAIPRSACQQYPDGGPCSGHVTAWYWDSGEERCKTFLYGGCKGNRNNFITRDECRAVCDIGTL